MLQENGRKLLDLATTIPYNLKTAYANWFSQKLEENERKCFSHTTCIPYNIIIFGFSYQGGGWCNNATTCLARRDNRLGSSKKMVKQIAFSGMLSNKQNFNPGTTQITN